MVEAVTPDSDLQEMADAVMRWRLVTTALAPVGLEQLIEVQASRRAATYRLEDVADRYLAQHCRELLDEVYQQRLQRVRMLDDPQARDWLVRGAGVVLPSCEQLALWRSQRQVVSVLVNGEDRFPDFQFDVQMRPYPMMAELIDRWDDDDLLGLVMWCLTPNSHLSGMVPADLFHTGLSSDHDDVVKALVARVSGVGTAS